jgi:glycosyltransferase involved in cell wall biosynthesis
MIDPARMIEDAVVVVPAYNEAESLQATLTELMRHARSIVVVDDGSQDETLKEAHKKAVQCLRHATNQGYGAAIQTGVRWAMNNLDEPYIITFDADGQHDPAYLENLLEPLRKDTADYMIGSRFLEQQPSPIIGARLLGSLILARATSIIIRKKITDPTSGMLAFTRELARIIISPYFPHDYPDADFLIMIAKMGFRISETHVLMRPSPPQKISMHAGMVRPLYYTAKMSLSMINLATRRDLKKIRRDMESDT